MLKTSGFLGRSNDSSLPAPKAAAPAPSSTSIQPKPIDDGASPKAATPAPSSAESTIGNRLIVGPDVKLKGAEINDCDTLIVEGRVEATLDSRIIRVAELGSFNGTVGVDTAEIHGRFDGELTARGQLFIHASGHVNGKIRYGKLLIEEGGQISGDVQAIAANAAPIQSVAMKPKSVVSASL